MNTKEQEAGQTRRYKDRLGTSFNMVTDEIVQEREYKERKKAKSLKIKGEALSGSNVVGRPQYRC